MKNQRNLLIFCIIIGAVIGGAMTRYILPLTAVQTSAKQPSLSATNKPLYWVAPMDANYKRDKPGKSPMGMDLIPVYQNDQTANGGAGTISVDPDVINNLGVRTAVAQYQALHTQINTVGYVTYDEDKLVHIHPRVQGWIEKLFVKAEGDPVRKGQPLYNIYSPELVNAQEEFLLALQRQNARLITAARERLTALQLSESTINELEKSRKVQQTVTFYAPQTGVVERLKIRQGFFVKPDTTIMAIGDLADVWVEAEVFARQANQVKIGTPVTMTLDYLPGKTYRGKVNYIYPTLDTKTRTLKVRLIFENALAEFKPNMFAQVALHTGTNQQVLLIPKEALIRTGKQDRVVLALGTGHFKSIAVTVGRYDHDFVEILSGLSAGDKVVSSAQFLLDSESSKTSDFQRMHHASKTTANKKTTQSLLTEKENKPSQSVASATVNGTVKSVMPANRIVNIDREAINKWQRDAANVDFIVADNVDFSLFTKNAYLMFTFEVHDDNFVIVSAMAMSPKTNKPMGDM